MLLTMNYLNLLSLVRFSLVCTRFLHLSRDASVWKSVELTHNSIGRKVNSLTLKRLIRLYLPPSLSRVVLEEVNLKGNLTITEALIDLLFGNCPKIDSITLINCDLRKVCEEAKELKLKGKPEKILRQLLATPQALVEIYIFFFFSRGGTV